MKFVVPPLFALFIALGVHSLFFQREHDWDLDAFLYLGARLHHGELLYLRDFETKLPLLQYVFALASALGGIGAWRLITLLVAAGLGIAASYVLASDYLRRNPATPITRGGLASLLSALYLALLYALPESGSAHIEMVAASTAYVSFALLPADGRTEAKLLRHSLCGVFLALAALIRPNYVYLLPFYALWAFWRVAHGDRLRAGMYSAIALAAGFGLAVLACFSPYLFVTGGVAALADGLKALANFAEGYDVAALARSQMGDATALFYLPVYAACILALIGMVRDRNDIRRSPFWIYGVPAVSAVTLIDLSFVRNHYWPHNAIMLVPYAVPLVMLPLGRLRSMRAGRPGIRAAAAASLLLLALLNPTLAVVHAGAEMIRGGPVFDGRINRRRIDPRLLDFLAAEKARGASFLVAEAPIYHMLLGESRIGDGHPAMLDHVLRGKRIGPIAAIRIYTGAVHANPCLAVTASGKTVIVMQRGSQLSMLIENCLRANPHGYRKLAVEGLVDYMIYASEAARDR